ELRRLGIERRDGLRRRHHEAVLVAQPRDDRRLHRRSIHLNDSAASALPPTAQPSAGRKPKPMLANAGRSSTMLTGNTSPNANAIHGPTRLDGPRPGGVPRRPRRNPPRQSRASARSTTSVTKNGNSCTSVLRSAATTTG